MTTEQLKEPEGSSPGSRRADPFARFAMRRTARKAVVLYSAARRSLRFKRRSQPAASEIRLPDVPIQPGAQYVESIYQASVGAGARVIAVIGVESGDGATACARALARRSALAQSRTLLVDASESPEPSTAGLDTVGYVRLADHKHDPFSLRSPELLRRLWAEAHKEWETIVIDCGPALEGRDFDVPGRLTARSADAAILVCLAGRTTEDAIAAAKAALGPANIVGVVVNGRDMPTVGADLARVVRRAEPLLPKLSRRLAERALKSKLLDVPA